jgi:hypothetical protein
LQAASGVAKFFMKVVIWMFLRSGNVHLV